MINNECSGCEYKCSLSHIDICTLGSPCPHQRSEPMTNEEYLRSCNTEQLAEHILNVWLDGALNVNAEFGLNEAQIEKHKGYIVEWLKQPHKE